MSATPPSSDLKQQLTLLQVSYSEQFNTLFGQLFTDLSSTFELYLQTVGKGMAQADGQQTGSGQGVRSLPFFIDTVGDPGLLKLLEDTPQDDPMNQEGEPEEVDTSFINLTAETEMNTTEQDTVVRPKGKKKKKKAKAILEDGELSDDDDDENTAAPGQAPKGLDLICLSSNDDDESSISSLEGSSSIVQPQQQQPSMGMPATAPQMPRAPEAARPSGQSPRGRLIRYQMVHLDRRLIPCSIGCSINFDTLNQLEEHYRQEHPQANTGTCCGHLITGLSNIIQHERITHEKGLFECAYAGCSFTGQTRSIVMMHYDGLHRGGPQRMPAANQQQSSSGRPPLPYSDLYYPGP